MRLRGSSAVVAVAVFAALAPASALAAADVSVSVTATTSTLPFGGSANSEVVLAAKNEGSDPADAVTVKTNVGEPRLSFVGFVSISQGSGIRSGDEITANFGTIGAGTTATLKWLVKAGTQSGIAQVVANGTTSTADPNSGNNSSAITIDVPALQVSDASLAFGSQLVGGIGAPRTLTVTNAAAIPLQIGHIGLKGEDFVVSADSCSGISIPVGGTCQIASRFAPAAAGDRSGGITVESSTAGAQPLDVPLTGVGVEPTPPDETAAALTLNGVPKSIVASRFRRGFDVRVTPSEPAALDVELFGKARAGALASAFDLRLFGSSLPLAAGARTVKVKPAKRLLGKLKKKLKVQLRLRATDAAGNVSTTTQAIVVKPNTRKK